MYSVSIFGTHHIFFPPRFEVVAGEEAAGGVTAHLGDDPALDRLLRDEVDGPPCPSFGGRPAHHRRESGLFLGTQQLGRTRARFLFEAGLEAKLDAAPSHSPNLSRIGPDRRSDRLERPPLTKELEHSKPLPATIGQRLSLLRGDPRQVIRTEFETREPFSCHDDGRSEVEIGRKWQADQYVGNSALDLLG